MPVSIPIEVVAIESNGFHLFTYLDINNIPAHFLIDTGASRSVCDQKRIKRFQSKVNKIQIDSHSVGLGNSHLDSHLVILDTLKFGQNLLKKVPMVVLNLSNVNKTYKRIGLKEIDGIIGNDLLIECRTTINLNKKSLIIYKLKPYYSSTLIKPFEELRFLADKRQ